MTGGDAMTLPAPIAAGHGRVSTLDQFAEIPEEEIWLQKQKSARTRRTYRLDVQHFMRTLAITTPAELRQADHLKSEHRRIRREAEEDAADRLVMRLLPLGLLRGGMHVAEAALEWAVVEDRRRA